MVRTLRIAAAVVAIAAAAAIILPHLRWWMEGSLYDGYYLVFDVANAIGVMIAAGAPALALLALAGIVERLDSIRQRQSGLAEAAATAASSPTGSAPIWNRLASARVLRIAAAAVIAATVATAVMPYLYLWWVMIWGRETVLHDTYFVIDAASNVGLLVVAGVATLVLVALARILDRLDQIDRRADSDAGHDA